jgi:hypothetical protein
MAGHDRSNHPAADALEAFAASARGGFACMFSTSEEYESALIRQRRAEGRYAKPSRLPAVLFIGCSLAIALVVLIAS